jgi:hypothetical protein
MTDKTAMESSNPQLTPPHLMEELESLFTGRGRGPGSYHLRRIAGQAKSEIERLTQWVAEEEEENNARYDLMRKKDAQIERLTRELQGTKDELYSVDKAAKELGAERDRLRAALADVQPILEAHLKFDSETWGSGEHEDIRDALNAVREAEGAYMPRAKMCDCPGGEAEHVRGCKYCA